MSASPSFSVRAVTVPTETGLPRSRSRTVALMIAVAFLGVAGQLVRMALEAEPKSGPRIAMMTASQTKSFARPDIVDRNGRLLATDVKVPSLYADPVLVQDADEVAERLNSLFPDLDPAELRRSLSDKTKRFVWIKRGLSPKVAQAAHNLGYPGLMFIDELKRTYPVGSLAGHSLGRVDVDNKGLSGLERYVDQSGGAEAVNSATLSARAPVRSSIDVAVSHAVESELAAAIRRYDAKSAAGVVLDVTTGEVLASVSLPGSDPSRADQSQDPARIDKISAGTFELGSIFKTVTLAMAFEQGMSPDTMVDASAPLIAGRFKIEDLHPLNRPISLTEVFLHSSNIGAAQVALMAGADLQKAFLEKLGLVSAQSTELGQGPAPQVPREFGRAEQMTIAYGHGLATSPLQFAAATAALINGGTRVTPTFLAASMEAKPGERLVGVSTSMAMQTLFRANVIDPNGTGQRADVPGLRVGGKTGTAEMAVNGGYKEKSVLASFVGAFPMDAPRFVTLVLLFEPKGSSETGGQITAGRNAAPTTGRIISRIAPLLGVDASGS